MALVGCRQSKYQATSAPVSVSKRPASLSECSNGGTVVLVGNTAVVSCNGLDGATGATGAQGPKGNTGSSGAPGTIVGVVQLCPGVSSYPGRFVEVALLIGNKLYAVYSQNGGFLTYLPPGTYTSNGIGSACNFIVNTDNTISH